MVAMNPPCRIELLGNLRVIMGDRVITRFQTQKTGALLAFLALNPSRQFVRESVAEMLWPDGEPIAIRNRLNQAVSSLRRQLHPPGSEANAVIVADHQTISINPVTVTTDVEAFQRLLKEAEKAEGTDKVHILRQAVDLYQGDLLQGSNEEWAALERVPLADQYYGALTQLIRLYANSNRVSEAIEIANRRLAQDPGDERSHRALMKLYLMAGRPRSALAQYAELERSLNIEGEAPSTRTLDLRDEALKAVSEEPDAENQSHPEELKIEVPPIKDELGWLPKYLTSFFGREKEWQAIQDALNAGRRLISLVGLGGAGKTRLAVEAGWRLVEAERGSVFFISLAEVKSVSEMKEEITRLAGSALGGDTKGGPTILILDTMEQLISEDLAELTALLRANPRLIVIATTRQPLDLEGECVIPILPLPVSEGGSIEDLIKNPAIALFVGRAQAARQDFQLTERTSEAIVALCRRLEGWPLALELAASWARSMTPGQMVERVSEHYDFLASRRKDIDSRHRSMRAAIDGSYARLTVSLKETLCRVAVFEGGWDHAAAGQVCPGVDVYQTLSELEEACLVHAELVDGLARFSMLDTVRAFAHDQTTPDLAAETGRLHAEYYRSVVARSIRKGPTGVIAIRRERSNVLAALSYWIQSGSVKEALSMATDLGAYWDVSGRIHEGIEFIERVLAIAEEGEALDRGLLLARFGRLLWFGSDYERSKAVNEEALAIFRAVDDIEGILEITITIAQEAHRQSDFDRSVRMLEENVSLARQVGERWIEAKSLLALGNGLVELKRWDEAESAYDSALTVGRELDEATLVGAATANLGHLMMVRGSLDVAQVWLSSARRMFEEAGLRAYAIDADVMNARLFLMRGDPHRALDFARAAIRVGIEPTSMRWGAFLEAAYALNRLKQFDRAAQIYGFVESVWKATKGTVFGIEVAFYEQELGCLKKDAGVERVAEQMEIGRRLEDAQAVELVFAEV